MNPRAAILIAVLFAPSVWAQEPASETTVVAPGSFDRSSESIRKIVRDFAASQSVPIQLAELKVGREPPAIKYVPPEKPPKEPPAPRRAQKPAESPDTFFSALVGAVIEVAIDDLLDRVPGEYDEGTTCVSHQGHCVSSDPLPPAPTHR